MRDFEDVLLMSGQFLEKGKISCLQMNLGYKCNLNCNHCHVEAGPHRHEQMDLAVIEDCLRFVKNARVKTVDITGGAPEMNPNLRYLIHELRKLPFVESILVRSNLAILDEDKYEDLPQFFAENKVDIVASLPCYLEENVTYQRGKGVYSKNIRILQKLNRLGYGKAGLKLNLVYNPGGNFLPGPQQELESAYKENLRQRFGIEFNSLYTITNMPIGRFRSSLEKQGLLDGYLNLLTENFNSENLGKVMCRNLINVDWQGRVYDCDFNHVLKLAIDIKDNYIGSIKPGDLVGRPIKVGSHCLTCVAGAGSSCQGSLKNKAV
ncbi:radical SAM/Cys-rich domain-containing protein [Sporomusa malonica]|uniref:Radical SAM/Cys-rich domain-containing protein n=2 Tax=Sporomusa malonica TaxID=112901 RepID=A0A1W1YMW9_9FIRM|nr:radical SAM/Cys-rich domain-containing protein [Sporomusa malonica]